MDYTRLLSRTQFEHIAARQGYKNVTRLPYAQLEQIAVTARAEALKVYKQSRQPKQNKPTMDRAA